MKLKSFLLVFSMLIFFDSNAQVTFSITNASSVNANDGQVVASVNPGSGNYTFYWEDLSTNLPLMDLQILQLQLILFNAPSGTYLLTFIDVGLGTFSNDTIFISAPGGLFSYSGLLDFVLITTQLTANLSGCSYLNPSLGIDYALSNSSGSVLFSANSILDSVSLPAIGAGTYYMSAANLDNGCVTIDTFTVSTGTLSASVYTSNILGPNNLGSVSITASGGNPPYSIFWSSGSTGSTLNNWTNGDTIQNLSAGTYSYFINSSGCIVNGTITIVNACDASFISNYDVCDESINLSATMNMTNTGSFLMIMNFQIVQVLLRI